MVARLSCACLALSFVVSLAPASHAVPAFVAAPEIAEEPLLNMERYSGFGERHAISTDSRAGPGGRGRGMWSGYGQHELDYGTFTDDEDYPGVKPTPVRKPEIRHFYVDTSITARFANTLITSLLMNPVEYSQEAIFSVVLPEEAFISKFLMVIEDVVYEAEVKEKEKAQREYNAAKERGQTAGQVKQHDTKPNTFSISVNVAAFSNVLFNLTYQELLHRRHGVIEYRLNIDPGQLIKSLKVDIHITEPQSLQELSATWKPTYPGSSSANEVSPLLQDVIYAERLSQYHAHVKLHPSKDQQKMERAAGIAGHLVVQYDVLHDLSAGNLQVMNGYFVHYFSPEGLVPAHKNVVFVIDVSGSMRGFKMEQTKEAMRTILADIREGDRFNIVTFTDDIDVWWTDRMSDSTEENIVNALEYVDGLRGLYGTNLHGGVLAGVELLKTETLVDLQNRRHAFSMIIMLTDGLPSSGVTNIDQIRDDVLAAIDGKMALYCLGFGHDLDHDFLENLASENQGVARKIYTDSSASLQLKGFYDEVATPLLFNINIDYNHIQPGATTQTSFLSYFEGTEIVVAGRLPSEISLLEAGEGVTELVATVSANSMDDLIELEITTSIQTPPAAVLSRHVVDDFCQRLWAYLTIKSLLKSTKIARTRQEKDELKASTLEMSMRYHFVTPLTSLLVIRPEDSQAENASLSIQDGSFLDSDIPEQPQDPVPVPLSSKHHLQRPAAVQHVPSARLHKMSSLKFVLFGGGGHGRSSGGGFVDSDPHFVVHVPSSGISVCFDIMGEAGQVFSLLEDNEMGLEVLGFIVASPKPVAENGRVRTYFGRLGVRLPGGHTVRLDTGDVTIDEHLVLTWKNTVTVQRGNWSIAIRNKQVVVATHDGAVSLAFMLHRMNPDNAFKVDHLGFYIVNHEGLSDGVHGLIGQFQRRAVHVGMTGSEAPEDGAKTELTVAGRRVRVVRRSRMNSLTGQLQPCWFARSNADGLIDGKHTDYLAPLKSMP